MRRAKQPLDAAAVQSANEALWQEFPELKGRQLGMGPEDAKYRQCWMDAYIAAAGPGSYTESTQKLGDSKRSCDQKNWVELKYAYPAWTPRVVDEAAEKSALERSLGSAGAVIAWQRWIDGRIAAQQDSIVLWNERKAGVPNAKYRIKDSRTGKLVCDVGTLDQKGFCHKEIPSGVSSIQYSFDDDPVQVEIYPDRKPLPNPLHTPNVPSLTAATDFKSRALFVLETLSTNSLRVWAYGPLGLLSIGSDQEPYEIMWEAIKGDFQENPSGRAILLRTLMGFVPILDTVLDVEDLVADLIHLGWTPGAVDDFWDGWFPLIITTIGFIPELGSGLKGIAKIAKRFSDLHLQGLVKRLNDLGPGNWIKKLEALRPAIGKHVDDAAAKLRTYIGRLETAASNLRKKLDSLTDAAAARIKKALDDLLQRIAAIKANIGKMYAEFKKHLEEWLDRVLRRKQHEEFGGSAKTTNKHVQKKLNPPRDRTPQLMDELATDPAHKGKPPSPKTRREADVAMDLEDAGVLDGSIKRDPNPAGADFVDGNGVKWDVKAFDDSHPGRKGNYNLQDSLSKIQKSLDKNENVIIDTANLTPSSIAELRKGVADKAWGDKIKWHPPQLND